MSKKNSSDRPQKVRSTIEELEVLSKLKESVEWVVVKRIASRYIRRLEKVSFKLTEQNPAYFAVRHSELAGQALGIKTLIRMIDESGKRLEKLEK